MAVDEVIIKFKGTVVSLSAAHKKKRKKKRK
jgi:hypothetical protein